MPSNKSSLLESRRRRVKDEDSRISPAPLKRLLVVVSPASSSFRKSLSSILEDSEKNQQQQQCPDSFSDIYKQSSSSTTTTMESQAPSLTRSFPSRDDSSRSYSSIDSCWSEELGNRHYRQQQKPSSTSRIYDYNRNNDNDDDTGNMCPRSGLRLTRSHSCPTKSSLEQEHELLKNDLYIPPSSKADDAYLRHKKKRRKNKRERRTAAGAMGGMVAGGVILGPIGVVLGAALGGFTIRQIVKKVDKLTQRRRERKSVRDFASSKSIQWALNDDAVVFA